MPGDSTVTVHMVSSLDGFIAKKDGSIEWMHSADHFEGGSVLSEEQIADFLASVDCYLMESKTYEHALVLGWPYGETPTYVLTSQNLVSERSNVKFMNGSLKEVVEAQLKPKHSNIWVVGGAETTRNLFQLDLVDKIVISIMPYLLGEGTLFFDFIGKEMPLHLVASTTYQDGMVELEYEVKKH